MTTREIKGWHVFVAMAAAFGIIIGVNLTLAVKAVDTFPGLEVRNSYVASQTYEARRDAQDALGWQVSAAVENGVFEIAITDAKGRPAAISSLEAVVGRPTIARDDQALVLEGARGLWRAPVDLGSGAWVLKLAAESQDGVAFTKRIDLWVK